MAFTLNPITGKLDYFESGSGGAVSSVTAADTTVTISPTTGAVLVGVNLAHAFSWAGAHTWGGIISIDPSSAIQLDVNTNFTVDDGGAVVAAGLTVPSIFSTLGAGIIDLGATFTRIADDNGLVVDTGLFTLQNLSTDVFIHDGVNATFLTPAIVPDDAYGAGWDGSFEVPTKNALYDKIQTIAGGSFSMTEAEIDFGTTPEWSKVFTVTDGAVTGSSKISAWSSGNLATSRVGNDDEWDMVTYSARAGTGQFTLTAQAFPGPIVGKRKFYYAIA